MDQFIWIPGQGIDPAALARLRANLKRPARPMGEAWFMGDDRHYFNELLGDMDALPCEDLQAALQEIYSGLSAFGPMDEWSDWYHFLLGKLLPRCHEVYVDSLLESLITGFMAVYPAGIQAPPYPGFQNDILQTLGRCMMQAEVWHGNEIIEGKILHRSNHCPSQTWGWWNASGDFSASLFFCLKYLPPSHIPGWLQSMLDIPAPHWRAQILAWMVGAHDLLQAQTPWPAQWPTQARPVIYWEGSHYLRPELIPAHPTQPAPAFIPEAARIAAQHYLASCFNEDRFLTWLLSLSRIPALENELAEIPATFERLYVCAG